MSFRTSRVLVFLACCLPLAALAVVNPVTYSLSPSGGFPATTTVGSSYAATYTLTNNLPFPVTISNVTRTHTGTHSFSTVDQCDGATLAALATCNIHVTLHPTAAGALSATFTIFYDKNVVPLLPALTTTAQSAGTAEITGVVSGKLPPKVTTGSGNLFEFTYTNVGTASVTASSVPVTTSNGAVSGVTNNCTSALTAGNSCTIIGTFTATVDGAASVTATYNYSGGSVPLTTQTQATSGGGGGTLTAINALELPTTTYQYADNVVKFEFLNNSSSSVTLSNTATLMVQLNGGAALSAPWITLGTNQCTSGKTLVPNTSGSISNPTAGSFCFVYASIVPQTTGSNLTVHAEVSYNSGAETATTVTQSSAVNANLTNSRMITVVNQCPFPVWMAFNAGSASSRTSCNNTTNPCPSGTFCNPSANGGNGGCYYSNPTQGVAQNGYMPAAQNGQAPATMDVTIPLSSGVGNTIYNAGIMARLGCTGSGEGNGTSTGVVCRVNTCATGSDGLCLPGTAPGSPPVAFNAVEFTFLKSFAITGGDGIYNDQIIDGVNVPMEMKGRGPAGTDALSPYGAFGCPAVGAVIQPVTGDATTQLGGCSYNMVGTTPSNLSDNTVMTYVTPDSSNILCDTNSDCTVSGEICGLALKTTAGGSGTLNKINKMCGTLLGYVSVNKGICSQGSSAWGVDKSGNNLATTVYANTFHCDDTLSGKSYTPANLYACSGTINVACTNDPSGVDCCGCSNWWEDGLSPAIIMPTKTQICGTPNNGGVSPPTDNLLWQQYARPAVRWVKAACPTTYAYPYDDKSSSVQCTVRSGDTMITNYQVTFCPGGATLETPYPTA